MKAKTFLEKIIELLYILETKDKNNKNLFDRPQLFLDGFLEISKLVDFYFQPFTIDMLVSDCDCINPDCERNKNIIFDGWDEVAGIDDMYYTNNKYSISLSGINKRFVGKPIDKFINHFEDLQFNENNKEIKELFK
jgi:hypothetical protein